VPPHGPEAAAAETDEALMLRYRDRDDERAFEALFMRYAGRLQAFFSRFGDRAASDAGDLLQKTFLQLHRARKDYEPGRPVRPWLYTIALNVRREEGRSRMRSREVALDLQDPGVREPSVEPQVSSASDRLLRRALGELSEIQREVITLHYFEGLSFPEIAEMLGATVSAVKVRAHRAYGELRRLLGEPERGG
jgi:RNA polymerase sigma-70 factor (ECF subfamily)